MTNWQAECARRTREAIRNRKNVVVVFTADFAGFDAGREWEPEPIEQIFSTRDGDNLENLESVLAKYKRVHKEDEYTYTAYFVK